MAGDTVQQIKDRLAIQEVIAPYVKLVKAGKSLRGLCPFHKEKTPSFHVSSERGSWHCFGCGQGGDMFSFIEKIEGIDFKGALKLLAEKAGVPVEYTGSRGSASKKERLYTIMSRAGEWYASLLAGNPAEAYARERRLTGETVRAWRIGYAPDAWRSLLEALTKEGFTLGELHAAGLIKEADGKPGTYYDRFRNRLMFPLRDTIGRIVAFTGRALPAPPAGRGGQGAPEQPAKYLNSPETELYRKSELLFGMDKAKDAIRVRGFAILVEGQMDVLLAHQAGFQNTIALSGTALSPRHVRLIKRYSENLMLILDADQAGFKATAKSAELALTEGLRVKAVRLPEGKDPADLASENPKELLHRIKSARPIVEFFLGELAEKESDPHRLLRVAEQVVLPLIRAIRSPMERDYFVQSAARVLGLSNEAVRESLARLPGTIPTEDNPPAADTRRPQSRSAREAREEQLLAIFHAYPHTPLAGRIKSEYARITEAPQLPRVEPSEPALFQAEHMLGEDPSESAADELLRAFEEAVIREAYQGAIRGLRRAESAGDADEIRRAQETCAQLASRLSAFGM